MHRTINLILLLLAIASAFALYVLKYDTRRMEVRVRVLERSLGKVEEDIALLKARRAHLARPDRIEPMARKLGLAPIRADQYLRVMPARGSSHPSSRKPSPNGGTIRDLGERIELTRSWPMKSGRNDG